MKFDELHILKGYFDPMAISDDDKARRQELADYLTDAFLYFFSVYEVHSMHNSMLKQALYEQLLADKISDAVSKVTGIDAYMSEHIRTLAKEVVQTTINHADKKKLNESQADPLKSDSSEDDSALLINNPLEPLDSPLPTSSGSLIEEELPLISEEDDEVEEIMENEAVSEYWFSIRRAMNIAYNETNTFLNYTDFVEAKERGSKTKTWLTMLDNKVRDTHEEVEGQTVGIDEYFQVGNSQMQFPHDLSLSPDPTEVINCRCAVDYK